MFEPIEGVPGHVVALRAVGKVTGEDYASVLVPAVDAAKAGGGKVRLLLELGEAFEGYDASAIAADAGVGIGHFSDFERVAVVTDVELLRTAIHLFAPLIPGEVHVYPLAEGAEARTWISA